MPKFLPSGLVNTLLWSEELGHGWHPRDAIDYGEHYWLSYLDRDNSDMGSRLTDARAQMVRQFMGDRAHEVVDVGIGGGRFVDMLGCYGFDVNERAIEWLEENGKYRNPYHGDTAAVTCWDSLEHIPDPDALINAVDEFVFVSMPIYADQADCLLSKHYKPGEHIWYFTEQGLVDYMSNLGFTCLLVDDVESRLGREGIKSFVFKRIAK